MQFQTSQFPQCEQEFTCKKKKCCKKYKKKGVSCKKCPKMGGID